MPPSIARPLAPSLARPLVSALGGGRLPWEAEGGGPSPLASPLGLPSLHSWWHADLGVTDVGGYASAWTDQSGNVNDLSQGTAGVRPLITTTAAGKAALFFDPARQDVLERAAVSTVGSTRPALTFFASFEGGATSSFRELLQLDTGGTWVMRINNNQRWAMLVNGGDPAFAEAVTAEASGNLIRVIGTYTGTATGTATMTRNGAAAVSDGGTTISALSSATPPCRVGGRGGFGATDVKLRTAGIYTRALSASEITALDGYLARQL